MTYFKAESGSNPYPILEMEIEGGKLVFTYYSGPKKAVRFVIESDLDLQTVYTFAASVRPAVKPSVGPKGGTGTPPKPGG